MMRNKRLIITVLLIGILDFIGNRLFENYRFQIWYKPVSFILIVSTFILGYNYWKTRHYTWLKIFWSFIYSFIILYFIIFWTLEFTGYYYNNFIYKTFIHFGSTPLTFGFLYLIEYAVMSTDKTTSD